ncbi:Transcriptional regulator, ArsR family [Burkholderia diffusa]|nr:Transcriptional regulator, ArsR family [Burkholderia diffusa]
MACLLIVYFLFGTNRTMRKQELASSFPYFDYYRKMEMNQTIAALSALAHESRLAVFRALVQAGPSGLPAGQIATLLDVPPSSLSFHLKELAHAQLVTSRQEGRFVFYCANFATMNALIGYLTENCCGGNPCTPATACSTSCPDPT